MSRMQERKKFLQQQVAEQPATTGGIVLGQAPTKEQILQMAQQQQALHFVATAQSIFNQVVAQMLATQDKHESLTHEKMMWLAEQCRGAAPYVLQAFGATQIVEHVLPSEEPEPDPKAE